MLVYRFVKLALAAVTLFGQSAAAHTQCDNPSVRREWRTLSADERAEWIDAVKVRTLRRPSSFLASLTLPS